MRTELVSKTDLYLQFRFDAETVGIKDSEQGS